MKQAADSPTTKSPGSDAANAAVGVLALTFLDTTWRMAVPAILFTVLGIVADRKLHTKPWLTFVSVIAGFGLSVLLVKRQLAAVQKAEGEIKK